jgi:aquaporin Z
LTFVVLGVAVVDKQPAPEFIGLIIGSTVTAGGFAIGGVSGGCLNPAVSIGIAASHILGGGFFYKALFYTACQLVGGATAAWVFRVAYSGDETSSKGIKTFTGEFVGTFLLVLTVGCNVLTGNGTWGAVSIACVLMASIYAFAGASGAHLNPAVTAALAFAGKLDKRTSLAKQIVLYFSAQISGGLVAAFVYHMLFAKGFPLVPKTNHTSGAMLCELIYTFMLCFVVLNTAASKAIGGGKNQYFGLAIGFVIIAGGYGSGPLGAGCFNPAVAMSIFAGADFVDYNSEIAASGRCACYVLVEIAAAGLAAVLFSVIRPEEKDESSEPPRNGAGYTLQSKLISEVLGTFMLVFTVGLNVLGESKAAAFSIAASLTCMICAIGDVSGGHFNPAVTLAIQFCGKNKPDMKEAAFYILSQVVGAVLASFAYSFAYNGGTFPLGPGAGHGWGSVAAAETTFTFVLAFVVLSVAVVSNKPAPDFIGFIIGSCVTVGGFAIGGVSGGCLNPAVAIGIAASNVMGGGLFYKALIYSGFELLGGAAAAGLFKVVYESELPKGHPSLV